MPKINTFFNISLKCVFKMSSNLNANCYGFATWCSKLHFSSAGCRKPKSYSGKECAYYGSVIHSNEWPACSNLNQFLLEKFSLEGTHTDNLAIVVGRKNDDIY